MLTENEIKGKWNEIKGGIRSIWGRISNEELDQLKGNFNEVTGLVEERYGETKIEIKDKLEKLLNSFDNESDKNFSLNESSFLRKPESLDDQSDEIHPVHLKGAFKPSSFEKTP